MMYLLLTKCHENDRDEKVQHHKGHENNAGTNEKRTKQGIVIQDLRDHKVIAQFRNVIIYCNFIVNILY